MIYLTTDGSGAGKRSLCQQVLRLAAALVGAALFSSCSDFHAKSGLEQPASAAVSRQAGIPQARAAEPQLDDGVHLPKLNYPSESLQLGEQGRVVLRVSISAKGEVVKAAVKQSSGHARLDESALTAVRTARFKPYVKNGIAYPAMADIPFDFVLP